MYMQEVNWHTGYVCGSMQAENVPQAKTPVVTFWEGDIIDNVNHSFVTSKWGTEKKVDVKHWKRFKGFQSLSNRAEAACGRYTQNPFVHHPAWICRVGALIMQLLSHTTQMLMWFAGVMVCPRTHTSS